MSEIDIEIKGGEDLWEISLKKYDVLVKKINDMILETFPEVDCCVIGSCFETDAARKKREKQEKAVELRRQEKVKKELIEILKEPESQELMGDRVAALTGN